MSSLRIHSRRFAVACATLPTLFVLALLVGCSVDTVAISKIDSIRYVAAYGDSTTQGDGVDRNDRWTALLAAQTGWSVDNFGANGQKAEQIAARWGSVIPVGTVANGVIPGSGTAVLSLDVDVLAGTGLDIPTLEVDLRADNQSVIRGTLSRSGRDRVFQRASPGAAVSAQHVEIHAVIPEARREGLLILGMGVNNEPDLDAGTQDLAQIENWYRGVTQLHRGPLIVWGMLDRGLSEAPDTPHGVYIAQLESWLRSEYGPAFLPVRQYLSSQQALLDAVDFIPSFTPTIQDTAAVTAGCVPPSFRISTNSVHLNKLGHQLQARLIYRHLRSESQN